MSKNKCALGIEVYDHPAFSAFRQQFQAELKAAAKSAGMHPWATPDEVIAKLHGSDREKLRALLGASARRIFEGGIPYNRPGDAIASFASFVMQLGRVPNLGPNYLDMLFHVKTSNELLDPLRVFVSDKAHVKTFVKAELGDGYTVPTIALLETPEEVDAFAYPDDCAIKPTQASGLRILRQGGAAFDLATVKKWFGENYYFTSREVNYNQLKPRIIVEEFIHDFLELKLTCRAGEVKFSKVLSYAGKKKWINYFDVDWNPLDVTAQYERLESGVPKHPMYEESVRIARALSRQFNQVRIDCYLCPDRVYVGEITNCEHSGLVTYQPDSAHGLLSRLFFT
ncbi:MAG: ATP-grasp fold amidoligase family protein [Hyphomicrobiales bacterium]